HPGESNHQWGQAIDFGYKGLKLVKEDGTFLTITNEDVIDHLVAGWQREALYKARNKIAEHPPQGAGKLFRIRFKDNTGKLIDAGTADQIWMGNAAVTKAMLAMALTDAAKAKDPKAAAVKEASITAGQVAKMKEALKATFVLADQKWDPWKPL